MNDDIEEMMKHLPKAKSASSDDTSDRGCENCEKPKGRRKERVRVRTTNRQSGGQSKTALNTVSRECPECGRTFDR